MTGVGADRYKTCYQMLLRYKRAFSITRGFSTLKATAQATGDYPTQFSMLAIPEDAVVYFALKRDFAKRYVFSFRDHCIRLEQGRERNSWKLDNKGLPLSDFERP